MIPRLKQKYKEEVIPQLIKKFNYKNIMQAPKVEKVVINMGVGEAKQDASFLDAAMNELASITGQRPIKKFAKRSIAGFKLRKGNPIACMVTLRGNRMYDFLDKLFNLSLPRIRDFRGLSPDSFDKFGNYTIGIKEQIIFPEISYDKVKKIRGMNITIVTTTKVKEEAKELLKLLGLPIRE